MGRRLRWMEMEMEMDATGGGACGAVGGWRSVAWKEEMELDVPATGLLVVDGGGLAWLISRWVEGGDGGRERFEGKMFGEENGSALCFQRWFSNLFFFFLKNGC